METKSVTFTRIVGKAVPRLECALLVMAILLGSAIGMSRFAWAEGATEKANQRPAIAIATFAGGCFWCMEPPFDALDGVIKTVSGYTGGREPSPTYEQVSRGATGHAEAVQVYFDPDKVSYRTLIRTYWRNIDPVAKDRQFCDAGKQYRSAIFYHDEEQRRIAVASKQDLEARFSEPIQTEIVPAGEFYPAEEYHQDYYRKNPVRYKFYRWNCGRDQRLHEIWGD